MPSTTRRVTVIPSPRYPLPAEGIPLEYVRGIRPGGTSLPADEAQALIDAGLAVLKPVEAKFTKKEGD